MLGGAESLLSTVSPLVTLCSLLFQVYCTFPLSINHVLFVDSGSTNHHSKFSVPHHHRQLRTQLARKYHGWLPICLEYTKVRRFCKNWISTRCLSLVERKVPRDILGFVALVEISRVHVILSVTFSLFVWHLGKFKNISADGALSFSHQNCWR